jgi:rhodanese-related sulfurtransferase
MPSNTEITVSQLLKRIGLPDAPVIIDVRVPEDVAAEPRVIPTSIQRPYQSFHEPSVELSGRHVVIVCQRGLKLSQGVAALLRSQGVAAETLEGGMEAWRNAGGSMLRNALAPVALIKTTWVTRSRPKIDRVACPWLIKRFIDPDAVFLFVSPTEVRSVAERFGAIPFDIEDTFWSHRGELCTFDVMIDEFGLKAPALDRLARIVRAADTAQPDLSPEAAGLLAVSLGLSRMFKDDLLQLDAGIMVYDALYRWCRDATEETHNWPSNAAVGEGSKA